MTNITQVIDSWFTDHSDGEFLKADEDIPLQKLLPAHAASVFIYTGKPRWIPAGPLTTSPGLTCAIIGMYGALPAASHIAEIQQLTLGRPLLFLGDLDPVDFMVYLSLKHHLAPAQVIHLGINDQLISALNIEIFPYSFMQFSTNEEALALPVLKNLAADFLEQLGPKCNAILNSGQKLELEGLFNLHTVSSSLFWKHVAELANFTQH